MNRSQSHPAGTATAAPPTEPEHLHTAHLVALLNKLGVGSAPGESYELLLRALAATIRRLGWHLADHSAADRSDRNWGGTPGKWGP